MVVTTYEMCNAEAERLGRIPWQSMIVDEGHRLKSQNGLLYQTLCSFRSAHKVILSGTPVQNNLSEFFTMLHFLDPVKFSVEEEWLAKFGRMDNSSDVQQLHGLLGPYLLRRRKEDVETSIPPLVETLIRVGMTDVQKMHYRAVTEQNREYLSKVSPSPSVAVPAQRVKPAFVQFGKTLERAE